MKLELRCLCLLLLLYGRALAAPEPKFMLLVPTVLHGGSSEQVCVVFLNLNETISVIVVLKSQENNVTVLQKVIKDANAFHCESFQIANQESSEVAYITLLAKGESLEFKGKRSVLLKPIRNLVFVQTDKHIYKPGQQVQFRVVSLNEGFLPVNETFPLIYIEDPQRNHVYQWQQVTTGGGITQLSFPLSTEPIKGSYKVSVTRVGAEREDHSFIVQEYVLPKFEVFVKVPQKITIMETELNVKVCALYTFGKPVAGTISVDVCRHFSDSYYNCGPESKAICETFTRMADSKGCFAEVVKTKMFQLRRRGYDMKITVNAKMTEKGTGVELMGEASSQVTSTMATITFVEVDTVYQPGVPFFGQVRLEDSNNDPLPNETITIRMGRSESKYVTDLQGQASFSIDTASFTASTEYLMAFYKQNEYCGGYNWISPEYPSANHAVKRLTSRSRSYLKVEPKRATLHCNQEELVTIHYILTPESLGNAVEVKLYLLVMAKGGIVTKRSQVLKVDEGVTASGSFTMQLHISSSLAPQANVLIMTILPNGEVIADKTLFKIEKCFANKVKIDFSAQKTLPASSVNLQVEASPGSLCALNVVDKSVLLMASGKELTAEKVYDLIPVPVLSGYYHDYHNLEEPRDDPCIPAQTIVINGIYYMPIYPVHSDDAYQPLKAMGLKVLTNAEVRVPIPCIHAPPEPVPMPMAFGAGGISASSRSEALFPQRPFDLHYEGRGSDPLLSQPQKEIVRKYFPETWLWQLVMVDSTGKTEVPLTVPDTITEWNAGMFCTSEDVGFGLSPIVALTAFQPFFLELTLPYSVVRGEEFTLKATVFNYLSQCIRMHIVLEDSKDFLAQQLGGSKGTDCLCANEQETVSWSVTPKALGELNFTVSAEALQEGGMCGNEIPVALDQGRKDTVIKPLLVEPEGIEKEVTQNALLCAADGPVSEMMSLKLPENVVDGSARAYYSVLGDLLGTAMQNLDKLLQLPFGCGEQNMVLFTPNIYILEYLNKTGQLTEETKSKAIGYLTVGYQRQLTYMHDSGSYSAFGSRFGGDGNTWLTAFVLKSFARAKSLIFINEQLLSRSLEWLSARQKATGCFQAVGQLFNNAMKGGVDDEVTLSAYITIALLEYPLNITHPVIESALFCLEKASEHLDNVYTKALVSYALTLAGSEHQAAKLMDSLEAEAIIEEDGSVHWERSKVPQEETDMPFYYHRAPSAEVEMTSYVLLAVLSKQSVSQEDLTKAAKIVKWVTKQQNPNGGFSSTQDTVVALQALSTYGAATYTKSGERLVTVRSSGEFQTQFHVNNGNRLLLQRILLPDVPGNYTTDVHGNGCVYTQMTLRYNIPHPTRESPFHVSVKTIPDTCQQKSRKSFDISVNVSYVGKRPVSNMVVVEVKMVSGYIPMKSSATGIWTNPFVRRTDMKPNQVIIYLENVANDWTSSLTFSVEQENPVTNLQPATVKVYDYYETAEYEIVEYSAPCGAEKQKK
ncbi:alpha-2-macroglobulin-like [Lissotriton helveticus]